ncbi:MAG: DMT family transporter [Deltaproteobacteria bacterium]|nr:DMT family transporter [Deltaproteobacteria bacterium]MBW2172177.1 DMT family transporter [Deltaproteobacteria bacterium]
MYRAQLRWQPIAILLVLALIWGANMAIIKLGARELPPLLMAALRSTVASACLYVWIKSKKISLFPSVNVLVHGIVVGLLFGCEFACIYVGLQHTLASRTYVLLYTTPFFVAVGAHFLLEDDRLNPWKAAGLASAFAGVVTLFMKDLGSFSLTTLPGDLMILVGGLLWASTTIYLKKYLVHRTIPLQTLFYQVFFSAPLLFLMSIAFEDQVVPSLSWVGAFSVFYQCIIVAFLSYLVWFELIHRYPVSLLHGFSFFTPVFGVFLSGALIMGEVITPSLLMALALVTLGMILVNRRPGTG